MHELRDVVGETPRGGARELVGCDQAGLDEKSGDEGRNERCGGAETRLGHVCECDPCWAEGWYFCERGERDGQVAALELYRSQATGRF